MDREADIGAVQLTLEDRHRLLRPTAHHLKSQIGQGTTCGSHHASDPRGLGDVVLRHPEDDDRALLALSTTRVLTPTLLPTGTKDNAARIRPSAQKMTEGSTVTNVR